MLNTEAKQKICPFIAGVNHGGWDRNNGEPANINCIAENCMAWHWHIEEHHPIKGLIFSKTDGYCRRIHEGEI